MKLQMMLLLMLTGMGLPACNSKKNNSSSNSSPIHVSIDEADWKNRFKNLILCNCVLTGLADSTVRMKFLTMDKSFYDPINMVMEKDIQEALVPVISAMKKDSVASLTTVGEGAQGKSVFNHCIKYFRSNEMDSLANIKFIQWQHTNIDSVMAIKFPSY